MANEIDEPIKVVDYDPRWPDWYAADAEELSRALGTRRREVQHFGSTAVPGTAAKPIIDILVAPVDWPLAATDRSTLERLEYEYLGEANVPDESPLGGEQRTIRTCRSSNGDRPSGATIFFFGIFCGHMKTTPPSTPGPRNRRGRITRTLLAYSARKAHIVTTLLKPAQRWRGR